MRKLLCVVVMRRFIEPHVYGFGYFAWKIVAFFWLFCQFFCITNLALLYCILAVFNHILCCKEQQEKCKNRSSAVETNFPRPWKALEILFHFFQHDVFMVEFLFGLRLRLPIGFTLRSGCTFWLCSRSRHWRRRVRTHKTGAFVVFP